MYMLILWAPPSASSSSVSRFITLGRFITLAVVASSLSASSLSACIFVSLLGHRCTFVLLNSGWAGAAPEPLVVACARPLPHLEPRSSRRASHACVPVCRFDAWYGTMHSRRTLCQEIRCVADPK